jgi:hypothetical protein
MNGLIVGFMFVGGFIFIPLIGILHEYIINYKNENK